MNIQRVDLEFGDALRRSARRSGISFNSLSASSAPLREVPMKSPKETSLREAKSTARESVRRFHPTAIGYRFITLPTRGATPAVDFPRAEAQSTRSFVWDHCDAYATLFPNQSSDRMTFRCAPCHRSSPRSARDPAKNLDQAVIFSILFKAAAGFNMQPCQSEARRRTSRNPMLLSVSWLMPSRLVSAFHQSQSSGPPAKDTSSQMAFNRLRT